ncbi:kynurenine formamidase-like isoform X1 [Pieris napi]|uniref:kynurenine formamidase-like isoform X1 n=1 Tax=Pieris napi TaxID=78633 RepID=UPI001FBABF7F|nr:kynurenine formamidase-like isoform X1 [Pieris napi]
MCVLYFCVFALFYINVTAHINSLNAVLFNGDYEFIDLSYPFDANTIYWPQAQKFQFTKQIINEGVNWYSSKEFVASEHGGTHLDAPYHFYEQGNFVGNIPLKDLIVPLIIADVSSLVNDDPNFVLYKHHLDFMINDNFGKPCLIVFKFGWSKFVNDKQKYLGLGPNNTLNFPGLSSEVMDWITTSYKNVVGVGVDTSSVDPGASKDLPVHKLGSKAGLYNIENVNLSRPIPEYGCTALVMPMKIAQGSGAPVRFVAICPKQVQTEF